MNTEQLITPGTRVRVHMNLHRQRQGLPHWSVTDPRTGKVIANVATCTIRDAVPKVSAAGHRSIVRKGKRAVYARVEGLWIGTGIPANATGREIHLNPHRCPDFTEADGTTWTGSRYAAFPLAGHLVAVDGAS